MDSCQENAIEFLKDQQRATVTFSQKRFKNKIRKLAQEYPEQCEIIAENKDGSMCGHIPVAWVKISPPKVLSESQLETAHRNLEKARSAGSENA